MQRSGVGEFEGKIGEYISKRAMLRGGGGGDLKRNE